MNIDTPLERLDSALQKYTRERVPQIGLAIYREIAEELFVEEAAMIPVGTLKTSPHPGKAAASLRAGVGHPVYAGLPDQVGYARQGAAEFQSVKGSMRLDAPVYYTDDARTDGAATGYFPVLDLGRHTDSRGRLAGSVQAPEGVSKPTIQAVVSRAAEIVRRALAKIGAA